MPDVRDYTVGWICALTTEMVAAVALLDEKHDRPAVGENDNNSYRLGRIAQHNVVIAILPKQEYGTNAAAAVARDMLRSFPNIKIGLMVGVGGGVPSVRHDIRLGDVVVSNPHNGLGGVFQYDFGKALQDGTLQYTALLDQPPTILRTAVANLDVEYELEGHQLEDIIRTTLQKNPRLANKYAKPPTASDTLYKSDFVHVDPLQECRLLCDSDVSHVVSRPRREEGDMLVVHYGLIASGNKAIKDSQTRDSLAREMDVLCFEMEAAGLMNHFPCIVIRGICDYADSHKNKLWQGFAAMAAAAYTKDLLCQIPSKKVELEKNMTEVLENVKHGLEKMQTISQEIKSTMHTMKKDDEDDRLQNWLAPADSSVNIEKAKSRRHSGTGAWFVNGEVFTEWKRDDRRHLWLRGSPGCGKTILSVTVLESLTQMEGCTILRFFFDFSDNEKQKLDGMLRALIFELADAQPKLRVYLQKLWEIHDKGRKTPSEKSLSNTLHDMLGQIPQRVCVLIDAIDECVERGALVGWMQMLTSSIANIKFLVTGRPEEIFEQNIPRLFEPGNCILLEKQAIDSDIRAYVEARVTTGGDFQRWSKRPDVLEQIKHAIASKAGGMFRWAACQLDSLEDCRDSESLEDALRSLPLDLNETYARILESMPKSRRTKTMRLLQFLACAERPLSRAQAVDIVAIRLEDGYFDPADRLPRPEEILAYCSSLVSVVELGLSNGPRRRPIGGQIALQLAHFSVKEYLMRYNENFTYPEPMTTVTRMCLAYWQSVEYRNFYDRPLARYAGKMWMGYAKDVEREPEVLEAIEKFFSDKDRSQLWVKIVGPESIFNPNGTSNRAKVQPLYLACKEGLIETAKLLLPKSRCMRSSIDSYEFELYRAATAGHLDIVQWLVSEGVSTNTRLNPLIAAAGEGHVAVVKWLLGRGTDVIYGKKDEHRCTISALQCAATKGSREIVQLLVDNEADVDAHATETALYAAARRGYLDIVELLLANGANVHIRHDDDAAATALDAAARSGYPKIVRILLEHGAIIQGSLCKHTVGSCDCLNTLECAAVGGNREVIQLLLDNGAEINSGKTSVLKAAVRRGDIAVLQLLFENGAEIEFQCQDEETALEFTASCGRVEVVQWMLDNGARIQGSAAIQSAAACGHLGIVQLLIEHGLDVNIVNPCRGYQTALMSAAYRGYYALVKLLLENGAEVNKTAVTAEETGVTSGSVGFENVDHIGDAGDETSAGGSQAVTMPVLWLSHIQTALRFACEGGSLDIVKLLVSHGADIHGDREDGHGHSYGSLIEVAVMSDAWDVANFLFLKGCTAHMGPKTPKLAEKLRSGMQMRDLQMVQSLLNIGVDLNGTDMNGTDMGYDLLCEAARTGNIDMVKQLLKAGVNVNYEDGTESALLVASEKGATEIVRLLLEAGADLSAEWANRGNALVVAIAKRHVEVFRSLRKNKENQSQR